MSFRWLTCCVGLILLSGCLYNVRERADEAVCSLAAMPYDLYPKAAEEKGRDKEKEKPGDKETRRQGDAEKEPALDVQTTALTTSSADATRLAGDDPQPLGGDTQQFPDKKKPRLPPIPPEVPGSETPLLPREVTPEVLRRIYGKLSPLAAAPVAVPGPNGKPYTLSTLQQVAAANSAQLHQAAYAVQAARGNVEKARAYKNPTVGWNVTPSNDGSTPGAQGPFIDQTITTGAKLKIAGAAAEMDLANAELAFRRARSDLATQVRNAYFALLVAKETMRVNQAFARFTDDIYRLYIEGHLEVGTVAAHEPAALRAQARSARMVYNQSIQAYIYAWNQLVAAIGLRHLPLTEVAGRIDAFIPYFDYDVVLAHVLRNHTDVLTAANGIDKARYNLKLAQVTPVPDFDFNVSVLKEYSLLPKQFVPTVTIGFPFPIWDRNRGGIISAQGALGSALEEPHRVEENLTTTLATAYSTYMQNLEALEDYRRYILPDQVRYYRGVIVRRDIDMTAQFGDVVTAQQALATSISSYLTTLGALWSSVVSVADLLQTDDLFQLGQRRAVPALPDLESLPRWPCCHDCPPVGMRNGDCGMRSPGTVRNGECGMRKQEDNRNSASQSPNPINRVTHFAEDVRGVRTNTTPFEDSRRATQVYSANATQVDLGSTSLTTNIVKPTKVESLSAPTTKREEGPADKEISRTLPRHLPSLKIRQTPDGNNPLLLEQPPPMPAVSGKQEPEI